MEVTHRLQTQSEPYSIDEKVIVNWKGCLYPAKVVKTSQNNKNYFVHFMGWSKNTDEWKISTDLYPHNAHNVKVLNDQRDFIQTNVLNKKKKGDSKSGACSSASSTTSDETKWKKPGPKPKIKIPSVKEKKVDKKVKTPKKAGSSTDSDSTKSLQVAKKGQLKSPAKVSSTKAPVRLPSKNLTKSKQSQDQKPIPASPKKPEKDEKIIKHLNGIFENRKEIKIEKPKSPIKVVTPIAPKLVGRPPKARVEAPRSCSRSPPTEPMPKSFSDLNIQSPNKPRARNNSNSSNTSSVSNLSEKNKKHNWMDEYWLSF